MLCETLTVGRDDAWVAVKDIVGYTSSCNMVNVEFGALRWCQSHNYQQKEIFTHSVADPVICECKDDPDAILPRRLNDVIQALKALWAIIQGPGALIPNLVVGQAGVVSIGKFRRGDGVESLTLLSVRSQNPGSETYPSSQDLHPSAFHLLEGGMNVVLTR